METPENVPASERWVPVSEADRELVLRELDAILASRHFRGSKRYPAFLKYVVNATLHGQSGNLKERTLGVEVFGRDPNYDTSADPVVRFSAGEVRKRIAQYYHENGSASQIQIELQVGSYVPEFQQRDSGNQRPEPATDAKNRHGFFSPARRGVIAALLLVSAVAGFGALVYRIRLAQKVSVGNKLWTPFVGTTRPILIVVGTNRNPKLQPEPPSTSFEEHMVGPYHHVSLATATALANLAGELRERGAAFEIKEDAETSLTDLHSRPVILVGAENNSWTMRLLAPFRFHFLPGPLARIEDAKNPQDTEWSIDFTKPYPSVSRDYAILARFRDATTEGPILVLAGVGAYGTEAASALVISPEYLKQVTNQIPPNWENRNLEIVLQSDVIDGKAGPPKVLTYTVW